MDIVNPNYGNDANQTFLHETYSNVTSLFFYQIILKYFSYFKN